jgi:hypothetical protein
LSGYPGAPGNFFSYNGRLLLTNLRIIFVVEPSKRTAKFTTFVLPCALVAPRDLTLKKPLMSADYIQGAVVPIEKGGLLGISQFRLQLDKDAAAFFEVCHPWSTECWVSFSCFLVHTLAAATEDAR